MYEQSYKSVQRVHEHDTHMLIPKEMEVNVMNEPLPYLKLALISEHYYRF